MSLSAQLPLSIGLRDDATFANFVAGDNAVACRAVQQADEEFIYLWGSAGSGKSHLLQAACHESGSASAIYLSLHEPDLIPATLDGLERIRLVCLDGLEAVAGHSGWELSLFNLYNRLRDGGQRLLVAGAAAPGRLEFQLDDLISRFGWGPVFQLAPLDDQGKRSALQRRAANRGMVLSHGVADYLLQHSPRDMHSLFALLERLDRDSLATQRRLTIPFVRQILR